MKKQPEKPCNGLEFSNKYWYKKYHERENGCWYVQTRIRNAKTRTTFKLVNGKVVLAARAFKILFNGQPPDGKGILHASCGDILCVRPDHHFWAAGRRIKAYGSEQKKKDQAKARRERKKAERDAWGVARDNQSQGAKRRIKRLACAEYVHLLADGTTPVQLIAKRFGISVTVVRVDAKAVGIKIKKQPVCKPHTPVWNTGGPFSGLALGKFGIYNSVFALGRI